MLKRVKNRVFGDGDDQNDKNGGNSSILSPSLLFETFSALATNWALGIH